MQHCCVFSFARLALLVYTLFSGMEVRHDDDDLRRMECDPDYFTGRDRAFVRAFRKLLNLLRQVKNEAELYAFRSVRFEKLKGSRAHQRSLRINKQWRLIVEIEKRETGNVIVVKKTEDYH